MLNKFHERNKIKELQKKIKITDLDCVCLLSLKALTLKVLTQVALQGSKLHQMLETMPISMGVGFLKIESFYAVVPQDTN